MVENLALNRALTVTWCGPEVLSFRTFTIIPSGRQGQVCAVAARPRRNEPQNDWIWTDLSVILVHHAPLKVPQQTKHLNNLIEGRHDLFVFWILNEFGQNGHIFSQILGISFDFIWTLSPTEDDARKKGLVPGPKPQKSHLQWVVQECKCLLQFNRHQLPHVRTEVGFQASLTQSYVKNYNELETYFVYTNKKKRLCHHQTASGAPRLALKGVVESHVDDHQICSTHESSLGREAGDSKFTAAWGRYLGSLELNEAG